MRKFYTLLLLACFFISGTSSIVYGSVQNPVTNQLAEEMKLVSESDYIKINITLKEQFNSQALLATAKLMNKAERRKYVIEVLKDFSALSQEGVIADLNNMQKSSAVKDVKTLWIANVITCKATASAINQLALRSDIDNIDYDERRVMIDPKENKDAFYVEGTPGGKEITWNILKINADDVWALGLNGEGIIVAVLDTGVNYNHLDLNDHVWESTEYPNHGYDFANDDDDPIDDHGHGTHCAGTVAGDGTAGSQTGVAPEATIMCCKVLDAGGGGSESGVWAAVQFSVEQGADLMSLSLGWQHSWGVNRQVWRETFDNSAAAGIIASVAAGNEGDQQGSYPIPDNVRTPGDLPPAWLHPDQTLTGGTSGIICVGSTTSNDILSGFSGRGPLDWSTIAPYNDYPYNPEMGLIRPDICAPGSNIKSLAHYSNDGYEDGWSGTSMATPANAGMIALMLQKNELLTPAQINQTIEETAVVITPGKNNNTGSGRIDALAAVEATSFPGPSYYAHSLNDASGNNNGMMDPGESVLLNLSMANFSEEIFDGVTVELSTDSEYITITDDSEYFGDFGISDIIEIDDAFAFEVADNIPGGEEIKFNLTASNADEEWESSFTEIPQGINLIAGTYSISDPLGNNNGRLDPGETADILIETSNMGQIDALESMAYLSTSNSLLTINTETFDLETIEAGQTSVASFNVTVDATAQIGTVLEVLYEATSGAYEVSHSFFPKVGVILEDFETGDFSQYEWEFDGNAPWTIVSTGAYEGTYAAKSGSIGDEQTSEMILTYEVAGADSISFFRKVSSEATYDFLRFYIDNTMMDEWSGEVDWSKVSYAVGAGEHTFSWVYFKDYSVANGDDCGWVDYIELPAPADGTMSVNAGGDEEVCENADFETSPNASNFETSEWTTSGTGAFEDETALNTTYYPSTDDYDNGSVILTLTVYGGGDSIEDDLLIEFLPLPEAAEAISGEDWVCMNNSSDYEVAVISNADSYEWSLYPANAGSVSGDGSSVTIQWATGFFGDVVLSVRGVNDCGEGEYSEDFAIIIDECTGVDEFNTNASVKITPNPSNGKFSIVLNQKDLNYQTLKITDFSGKILLEEKGSYAERIDLNLEHFNNGMYLMILENESSRLIKKILIQK